MSITAYSGHPGAGMTFQPLQSGEACTQCGYIHRSNTCPTDDEICAWYESQSEQWLSSLSRHVEGMTPRKAWNFFFRPTPATNTNGESLAARAAGGQGAGTVDYELAQCINTACNWEGPLCNAEFFCHLPPDVVIGCRFCGSALRLAR